jgi:hypothetical protein
MTLNGEPTPPKQFPVVTSATLSGLQMAVAERYFIQGTRIAC